MKSKVLEAAKRIVETNPDVEKMTDLELLNIALITGGGSILAISIYITVRIIIASDSEPEYRVDSDSGERTKGIVGCDPTKQMMETNEGFAEAVGED